MRVTNDLHWIELDVNTMGFPPDWRCELGTGPGSEVEVGAQDHWPDSIKAAAAAETIPPSAAAAATLGPVCRDDAGGAVE